MQYRWAFVQVNASALGGIEGVGSWTSSTLKSSVSDLTAHLPTDITHYVLPILEFWYQALAMYGHGGSWLSLIVILVGYETLPTAAPAAPAWRLVVEF